MNQLFGLINIIQLIASAGGGGSSSGGGGGGGSSSGGSGGDGDGGGGLLFLIAMITFVPFSKWGNRYRKQYAETNDESDYGAGKAAVWMAAVIVSLLAFVLGIAIFGAGLGIWYVGLPLTIGAITGSGQGLYGWFDKIKPNRKVQQGLAEAASKDKVWDEQFLKDGARRIYLQYQQDWSNFNIESMANYMTQRYYQHAVLMMQALHDMNRRNATTVRNIDILEIVDMNDAADNQDDRFTAGFVASLTDQLIDMKTGQIIYSWDSSGGSVENWQFRRDGQTWRLDGINPLTEDQGTLEAQVRDFANSVGAFYSLDWGRLLIPQRGQIFAGSLATGDINNHVIGRLADSGRSFSDGLIYQIYTFSSKPANDGGKIYLIGQITVPKYYGNILIRRRKGLFQFGVKGLQEVTTEWGDFNKKFQVFATSPEQVTSFELLNPQMMQWIEAAPFEINIEVIDNSIYFYAPMASARKMSADQYKTMLGILQGAYRELKM